MNSKIQSIPDGVVHSVGLPVDEKGNVVNSSNDFRSYTVAYTSTGSAPVLLSGMAYEVHLFCTTGCRVTFNAPLGSQKTLYVPPMKYLILPVHSLVSFSVISIAFGAIPAADGTLQILELF